MTSHKFIGFLLMVVILSTVSNFGKSTPIPADIEGDTPQIDNFGKTKENGLHPQTGTKDFTGTENILQGKDGQQPSTLDQPPSEKIDIEDERSKFKTAPSENDPSQEFPKTPPQDPENIKNLPPIDDGPSSPESKDSKTSSSDEAKTEEESQSEIDVHPSNQEEEKGNIENEPEHPDESSENNPQEGISNQDSGEVNNQPGENQKNPDQENKEELENQDDENTKEPTKEPENAVKTDEEGENTGQEESPGGNPKEGESKDSGNLSPGNENSQDEGNKNQDNNEKESNQPEDEDLTQGGKLVPEEGKQEKTIEEDANTVSSKPTPSEESLNEQEEGANNEESQTDEEDGGPQDGEKENQNGGQEIGPTGSTESPTGENVNNKGDTGEVVIATESLTKPEVVTENAELLQQIQASKSPTTLESTSVKSTSDEITLTIRSTPETTQSKLAEENTSTWTKKLPTTGPVSTSSIIHPTSPISPDSGTSQPPNIIYTGKTRAPTTSTSGSQSASTESVTKETSTHDDEKQTSTKVELKTTPEDDKLATSPQSTKIKVLPTSHSPTSTDLQVTSAEPTDAVVVIEPKVTTEEPPKETTTTEDIAEDTTKSGHGHNRKRPPPDAGREGGGEVKKITVSTKKTTVPVPVPIPTERPDKILSTTPKVNLTEEEEKDVLTKVKNFTNKIVKQYGSLKVSLVLLTVITLSFVLLFCCCKLCKSKRYKMRQRRLKEYGQEKEFLLNERNPRNQYSNDAVTLLDGSSEDEF